MNVSVTKRCNSWNEREQLRQKGQFWTPDWIADAMVYYVMAGSSNQLFDPAVGGGAFFRAAKRHAASLRRHVKLIGTEVDPSALEQAIAGGLERDDLADVTVTDFVLSPPPGRHDAIVANPPYVRHHRLEPAVKKRLREFGHTFAGIRFDGRAGLQLYFFLRCLERLSAGGRLAFLVSADICEGVFADRLWQWVLSNYCLDGVVVFEEAATPFPDVDTNPIVFFLRNASPGTSFGWASVKVPEAQSIIAWIRSSFSIHENEAISSSRRSIAEALRTGLSRPPRPEHDDQYVLGDFACAMRGIVTGDNDFFFLTRTRAKELRIPSEFLKPAIGRVRDASTDVLTDCFLDELDQKGRPTLLFSITGRSPDLPASVKTYLAEGEKRGLPNKPLIRTRNPWYQMETRKPPHFLFAYLGRRNVRFILNRAGVVPLTCLHCVYARKEDPSFVERLWRVLQHPKTIANLAWVGKSYGAGALKVEPRTLERLPLPADLVEAQGLVHEKSPAQTELALF